MVTFTRGSSGRIKQMIKSDIPLFASMKDVCHFIIDVYRIGEDPDSIDLDDFLFGEELRSSSGKLLGEFTDDYLKLTLLKKEDDRELVLGVRAPFSGVLEELLHG